MASIQSNSYHKLLTFARNHSIMLLKMLLSIYLLYLKGRTPIILSYDVMQRPSLRGFYPEENTKTDTAIILVLALYSISNSCWPTTYMKFSFRNYCLSLMMSTIYLRYQGSYNGAQFLYWNSSTCSMLIVTVNLSRVTLGRKRVALNCSNANNSQQARILNSNRILLLKIRQQTGRKYLQIM